MWEMSFSTRGKWQLFRRANLSQRGRRVRTFIRGIHSRLRAMITVRAQAHLCVLVILIRELRIYKICMEFLLPSGGDSPSGGKVRWRICSLLYVQLCNHRQGRSACGMAPFLSPSCSIAPGCGPRGRKSLTYDILFWKKLSGYDCYMKIKCYFCTPIIISRRVKTLQTRVLIAVSILRIWPDAVVSESRKALLCQSRGA